MFAKLRTEGLLSALTRHRLPLHRPPASDACAVPPSTPCPAPVAEMTVSPERLAGSALRRLHYRATRRHHNNKVMVMGSSTTSANTSTDSNATALTSVTNDSLSPPHTPTHEQTQRSADNDDDDAFLSVDTDASRLADIRPPKSPKAARNKHESRFDFDISPKRRGSEPRNKQNNAKMCSPRRRSVHVTANPLAGAPPPPGRTTIVVQQPSLSLDYGGCATVLLPPRRSPPDALLDASRAGDVACRVGHHARSQSVKAARRATELLSPPARARVASMPNTGGEEDYYRLRHFSITGKGVVNRGDSLRSRRSRSNTSVASSASSEHNPPTGCHSRHSSRDSSPGTRSYRVVVLGAPGVGKSSLVGQFMTSEYLHAYDTSIDDESGERSVCVLLAGEESEITFLDNPPSEVVQKSEGVHGYCVVYSSADRGSVLTAGRELRALGAGAGGAAVILVANKADLARSREVSTEEGKALATQYECKFIETSVGINHNVDELLVGLLTQIRLKQATDKGARRGRPRSPPATPPPPVVPRVAPLSANSTPRKRTRLSASVKVRGLLTRVWARDSLSRSCENLHVL